LDNPARTWLSAAWVYCLQNAGSAARAGVNPGIRNADKTNANVNGSLFVMSLLPSRMIPSAAV